ncbi:TPA: hypothetical protein ACMFP1_002875 [Pseudomonas aeruginosa]
MNLLFDTPQFRLVPAAQKMNYANVSNLLEVSCNGKEVYHPIEVNTLIFHLMDTLGVAVESRVTLYLDKAFVGWVFGICVDDEAIFDLWRYSETEFPPWLEIEPL